MNRRKVLALAGIGCGLGGGGYLGWNWYRSPTIPADMTVETLHVERDVSATSFSRDGESLASREEYYTVIEDTDTAERELADIDSVTEFSETTNFDDSDLVVVQNGMQSDPNLVLDSIKRTESGIEMDISVDAPWAVDDELITHSLLIRITDTADKSTGTVSVDIEGYV